jgi:putative ABC transport system permease protein
MQTIIQDIRYEFRLLVKNRSFTFVATLALALGIGANTAIFSVINAVLLEPLPYKEADRLVFVWGKNLQRNRPIDQVSYPDFTYWKKNNTVFEHLAASDDASYNLTGDGDPKAVIAYRFDADFFPMMGIAPSMGRTFLAEETTPGNDRVVVLSHRLWQNRYGADPDILGGSLLLDDAPYTVIGIMPPEFEHPKNVDLWTPLALDAGEQSRRDRRFLRVVGRLKPGITVERAQTEMERVARHIEQMAPAENTGDSVQVMPFRDMSVGDIETGLWVLFGAVGFVLLIACTNVASLLMIRASGRQHETALRMVLGAARRRLIRQFLTQGVLLGVIGGAFGLLIAYWGVQGLLVLFPGNVENLKIPRVESIPIDGWVLAFNLAASVLSGLFFGLAPALRGSRTDMNGLLKAGGRGAAAGVNRHRLRSGLVVTQLALAVVLLIGAGLLIKSFLRLQEVELGFNPNRVLTMRMFAANRHPEAPGQRLFISQILDRVNNIQGVASAATVTFLPLSGWQNSSDFYIEGRPPPRSGQELSADHRVISPNYFQTMEIPLMKGRLFNDRDSESAAQVVIINQTMARRFWPDHDPVGQRINLGSPEQPQMREIVGIVGNIRHSGPAKDPRPELYRPYQQDTMPGFLVTLTVRTKQNPLSMTGAVQRAIWSVDSNMPISYVVSLEQLAAELTMTRRVSMILLAVFAGIAQLLAAVGIYGVMAYTVTQRTSEVGIRMALGARSDHVMTMMMRHGVLLTAIGLAVGVPTAYALTHILSGLLYEVSPTDPVTFVALPLMLAGVTLSACYIPARRATRLNPMEALREG